MKERFKNTWWKRFKFRLLLFASLVSIVPLVLLASYNLYSFNKSILTNLKHQQELVTTKVAAEVNKKIIEVQKTLEMMLKYKESNLLCEYKSERENILYGVLEEVPSIEELVLVDRTGLITTKVSRCEVPLNKEKMYTDKKAEARVIKEGEPYYGSVRLGVKNQPVFTLGIPINTASCLNNGLFATVNLKDIMDRLATEAPGEGSYIFLVDSTGELIGHTDFSQVLEKKDVKKSFPKDFLKEKEKLKSKVETRQYTSYTGEKVLGTFAFVKDTDWIIFVEQPVDKAFLPFNNLALFWLIGTAVIIILVLTASIIFYLNFSKQLENLENGILKVLEGKYGYQVNVSAENEFGKLGTLLNKLSLELKEKREMEKNMKQLDKMAAIGLLASGIAHEVNNPLSSILLIAQDLQDQIKGKKIEEVLDSEKLKRYLKLIEGEINRCTKITGDLLNFSRPRNRKNELIQINDLIKNTVQLLKFKFEKENINLKLLLDPDLPVIFLDKLGLQQVLFNILVNAIDAIEKKGEITVISHHKNENIEITVKDTGKGIEPSQLERLFEPFYTTKPPGKGTGLGLSVSYALINNWGGTINISSELNRGTEVKILLPLKKDGDNSGAL